MRRLLAPAIALLLWLPCPAQQAKRPFDECLARAEAALARADLEDAGVALREALERDPRSRAAWALRARWAEKKADKDELAWSLYQEYRLGLAQKAPRSELDALRKQLESVDPLAKDVLDMGRVAISKLALLAKELEKDKRPHSAIRVLKQILALDPEQSSAAEAIQRIASSPDPSLAGEAKPKDLLAGISEEWIRKHDDDHKEWDRRARVERQNYVTSTDAGYEILVRASEAMEQMNAFYRQFFRYGDGEDGRSVPRIELRIFKNRDEYLKLGQSPAKWSGGQFTGDAVETYVGAGGFEELVGTLFHESAHQFVSLATQAAGWLNEGLASFFEGTRVLSNGTVLFNLPANHRLFPLVERMQAGWMEGPEDGADPKDVELVPKKAPRFGTVLENKYEWGPAWYAPTWGVVYFLYNYQDLEDGRFVYRNAFSEFVDKSAGREGEGAIQNFEKVVLGSPEPVTPGVNIPASKLVRLPKTVLELDDVWKKWLGELVDEQSGKLAVERPYRKWAQYALKRKDPRSAQEMFEKGLVALPNDAQLRIDYALWLAGEGASPDRATQLLSDALRIFERQEDPDEAAIAQAERQLEKLDPKRKTLARILEEITLSSRAVATRYLSAEMPLMAMEVSARLATELRAPKLMEVYADAARRSGKSIALWQLAYNESDLKGWSQAGVEDWKPDGRRLRCAFQGEPGQEFAFRFLSLDKLTSGDYSLEAEVLADKGKVAFAGLVFGKKSSTSFHAFVYFPGKTKTAELAGNAFADLASFYSDSANKTWQHAAVPDKTEPGRETGERWHKLRIDVTGANVDLWLDGKLLPGRDFGSLDVLRGSFGLISGPGNCAFRNVRYLTRPPGDPAPAIERALRLENLPADGSNASGSYTGQRAPFPKVASWVQGMRSDWNEVRYAPQLLVLWSLPQNKIVPIDAWLTELAQERANIGLEIVSVCSAFDDGRRVDNATLKRYLDEHPFPGSVAIDAVGAGAFGESVEQFGVQQFGFPRLLLIDIDGRVIWEGDPGFKKGGPTEDTPSYLKDPLDELSAKRNLVVFHKWMLDWVPARKALHEGEFAAAVPALQAARKLDRSVAPPVAEAQSCAEALELVLGSLDTLAETLTREEAQPALNALVEWGAAWGKPVDKKQLAANKALADARPAVRWAKLMSERESWKTRLASPKAAERGAQLREELAGMPGLFAKRLNEELAPLFAAEDWAGIASRLDRAAKLPAQWLAREYFHW